MPKSGPFRAIATVLTFAMATAVVALAVAWPRVTIAEPSDGANAQAEPGTKFGSVVVLGKLERDPATSHWTVHLHAHNRGADAASLGLRAGLTRTVLDPGDRAEPTPQTVWRDDAPIELAPDETADRTFEIPDKLAERLTRDADRPRGPWRANPMGGVGGGYRTIDYEVVLLRVKSPTKGHAG